MLLIKDCYVVADWSGNDLWKELLYTKEEAEIEKELAEKETGEEYKVLPLDDYFYRLACTHY